MVYLPAQSCSALPVIKERRSDRTRRNPGKSPMVEEVCAECSPFLTILGLSGLPRLTPEESDDVHTLLVYKGFEQVGREKSIKQA